MMNPSKIHLKHKRSRVMKLVSLLVGGICLATAGYAVGAAEGPQKPSEMTPDLMNKYRLSHQTIEKKYDCNGLNNELVRAYCERPVLGELDGQLHELLTKVKTMKPAFDSVDVDRDQKLWVTHHDQCVHDRDPWMCMELSYMARVSELQSQFNLVSRDGPLVYHCDQQQPDVTLTFFATDLPTVVVVYKNQHKEAFMGPMSHGTDYVSGELKVTERKQGATIYWDKQTTLNCTQAAR